MCRVFMCLETHFEQALFLCLGCWIPDNLTKLISKVLRISPGNVSGQKRGHSWKINEQLCLEATTTTKIELLDANTFWNSFVLPFFYVFLRDQLKWENLGLALVSFNYTVLAVRELLALLCVVFWVVETHYMEKIWFSTEGSRRRVMHKKQTNRAEFFALISTYTLQKI